MKRSAVKSSNVAALGYDSKTQLAEVEFTRGGVYKIEGMSFKEFKELKNADSIGKHYNMQVKNNPKYTIDKL